VILIQEASDTDPERNKEKPYFETIERVGEITNPYAREKGTSIYVMKNAKVDINEILRKEIAEKKSRK
jgi:hypothetical protein